jgi:hypothetical protein
LALIAGSSDYIRRHLGSEPIDEGPHFASVIHPPLQTGVEAAVVSAHAWLAP